MALASAFKAPPGVAESRHGGETESQGTCDRVGGVGSEVGPPSRPLIYVFIACLLYAKARA